MDETFRIDPFQSRPAPDVVDQPTVVLTDWRILLDQRGAQYAAGILPNGCTVRFTTRIVRSDPGIREFTTQSGRRYLLVGPPAGDPVLVSRIQLHGLSDFLFESTLATQQLWLAMQRSTH